MLEDGPVETLCISMYKRDMGKHALFPGSQPQTERSFMQTTAFTHTSNTSGTCHKLAVPHRTLATQLHQ